MAKQTHIAPPKTLHIPASVKALGDLAHVIITPMTKTHAHRMANVKSRKPIQRKKKKG